MKQETIDYQLKWRKNNKQWLDDYNEKNKEKIKKKARQRYLRNKPQYDAKRKAWYQSNKSRIIGKLKSKKETIDGKITQWKAGAKRRGIEWNLQSDFIKSLPLVCHYTGETLTLSVGFNNTLSIDRVDSAKSYSPDNVVPCCAIVNYMKNDFSTDEFLTFCGKIARYTEHRLTVQSENEINN